MTITRFDTKDSSIYLVGRFNALLAGTAIDPEKHRPDLDPPVSPGAVLTTQ